MNDLMDDYRYCAYITKGDEKNEYIYENEDVASEKASEFLKQGYQVHFYAYRDRELILPDILEE